MVKFISFKTVGLLVVGLLCIGGSGVLLFMGEGTRARTAFTPETRRLDALVTQVGALDARIRKAEALLVEEGRPNRGDVDSLNRQMRDLQSLVEAIDKRLEHHEKRVDSRPGTDDKIVKVEKRLRSGKPSGSSQSVYHVVRNGETLYRISKRYQISENELIRLNGLKDKTRIFVGQRLRVAPK